MIVRDNPTVFRLFLVVQGSVFPRIYGHILFQVCISTLILVVDRFVYDLPHTSMQPFLMLGVALSLFLGFRNNAAYDRWWQARMQWGQLSAAIRTIGHDSRIYLNEENRSEVLRLSGAFLHLHRAGLRNNSKSANDALLYIGHGQLNKFLKSSNPASAALQELGTCIAGFAKSDKLSGFGQRAFSDQLSAIELSRTSNEGISNTPMPFVYSLLVWRTAFLYCLLLPFGLIEAAGWMAPLFAGIAAYVFFGLAAVTDELEHPFLETVNGLPLDSICRSADINLAEQMGETPPPPLVVRKHILS